MILIQLIVIYKKKRYLYDLYTFRKHNAVLSDSYGTSWIWQVNLLLSSSCACSCKSPVLIHAIFYKKDLFYDPLWLILAVFCCRLQQPVTCGIECTRSIKKQCCSFHKASDCGITSNVFLKLLNYGQIEDSYTPLSIELNWIGKQEPKGFWERIAVKCNQSTTF